MCKLTQKGPVQNWDQALKPFFLGDGANHSTTIILYVNGWMVTCSIKCFKWSSWLLTESNIPFAFIICIWAFTVSCTLQVFTDHWKLAAISHTLLCIASGVTHWNHRSCRVWVSAGAQPFYKTSKHVGWLGWFSRQWPWPHWFKGGAGTPVLSCCAVDVHCSSDLYWMQRTGFGMLFWVRLYWNKIK